MGAVYCVTSCDPGVFVDESAEAITSQNPNDAWRIWAIPCQRRAIVLAEDVPAPGRLEIVCRARQRSRHPDDVTVWSGDDLQVYAVFAVLARVGRAVGRDAVDGDEGAVQDQVGVSVGLGAAQCRTQLRRSAASSFTVSSTYRQAVVVETANPAARSV